MSRVLLRSNPSLSIDQLIIGLDYVCGYFMQVWENEDDEAPILDVDMLTNGELLERVQEYADMEDPFNQGVLARVGCDIDPGLTSRQRERDQRACAVKLHEAGVLTVFQTADEYKEQRARLVHQRDIRKELQEVIKVIAAEAAAKAEEADNG
jgi:hypothetical protein